jgi:hypothetical protein
MIGGVSLFSRCSRATRGVEGLLTPDDPRKCLRPAIDA